MKGSHSRASNHHFPEVKALEEEEDSRDLAVRRAIETALTDKQREAVELFFFQGLSQSEIARELGIAQQVVQKRIFGANRRGAVVGGAIARLREALAPLARGKDGE
jgi:RNA polymerase sigma factor (sigma-70 family)